MNDLLDRLREPRYTHGGMAGPRLDEAVVLPLLREAADEIERLRGTIKGFTDALADIIILDGDAPAAVIARRGLGLPA